MNVFYQKKLHTLQQFRAGGIDAGEVCKKFVVIDRAFFRRFFKVYIFKLRMYPCDAIDTINHEYNSALLFALHKLKSEYDDEQCLEYLFKSCKHAVMKDISDRTKVLHSDSLAEIETITIPVIDDVILKRSVQKYICERYKDVQHGTTRFIVIKNIVDCIFQGKFTPCAELVQQTNVTKQAVNMMHNEILRDLQRHIQQGA